MKVKGNAKYIRRIHGRYYTESFPDVDIGDITFQKTKGRLTKGEWIGLVKLPAKSLAASRFGVEGEPPLDGLDWNAVDTEVKDRMALTFRTARLLPWLREKLGRNPSLFEMSCVIDAAKGDIENLVKENVPWID